MSLAKKNIFQSRSISELVYDELVRRIMSGEWKAGQMLESESRLASDLEVSVGTVRKALQKMREQQLIERRQGRGTFVVDQSSKDVPVRFSNFYDSKGRRTAGEVVSRSTANQFTDPQSAAKIKAQFVTDKYIFLHQVRTLDGQVFLSEDWYLSTYLFPNLDVEADFTHRLAVLAQKHGVILEAAREEVMLKPLSAQAAIDLDAEPGAPTIFVERKTYAIGGKLASIRQGFFILPPGCTYKVEMK